MVTIVKHEWHSHDRMYAIELDEDLLSEIYPDSDEDEIASLIERIENGEVDIDEIISNAYDNDVDIEWEFQADDCWTDRKGGYDVTYELGDENSWAEPETPPEPTHKCTNCKWTGQSYDAEWKFSENEDEDAKKVCPYCESDVALTEYGIQQEKENAERMAKWQKELDDVLEEGDE